MDRDALKLDIMLALKAKALTLFELSPYISDLNVKASQLARALDELVTDGHLVTDESSSTVGRLYKHANESSLSDLSGKLLPHRDPVREAHASEDAQERQPRYRRLHFQRADLGDDD